MKLDIMTSQYKGVAFYQELGRVLSQSGITEVFNIDENQPLDAINQNINKMIGFIAYHYDAGTLNDHDHRYISQLEC